MKFSSIHPVFLIFGIVAFFFSVKLAIIFWIIDYIAFQIEKHIKSKNNTGNK